MKYSAAKSHTHNYDQFYEANVLDDRILTHFVFKLDTYKTTQQRDSTLFLSFLGKIGGLAAALWIIFGLIGTWISSKLMMASLYKKMLVRQKNKNEMFWTNKL